MDKIDECGSCRFWRGHDGMDSSYGDCRRHPPIKGVSFEAGSGWVKLGMKQDFPETFRAAWCGDFDAAKTV